MQWLNKRVLIQIGLVPIEPATSLPSVQAQAADNRSTVGRWLTANLDLKTLIGAVSLVIMIVGFRIETVTRQTHFDDEAKSLRAGLTQANRRLDRLTADTVKRQDYEHDTHQQDLRLENLANGEQQIFTLLVQGYARPGSR